MTFYAYGNIQKIRLYDVLSIYKGSKAHADF